MKNYWVYIICSQRNGTLYIGITNNLSRRIYEHREKMVPGFTAKYTIDQLVYFEQFENVADALRREKTLKKWSRNSKINLIESHNPEWKDLYENEQIL